MKSIFCYRLTLCLLLVIPCHVSAELYKWIDDQGQVHYGDKPGKSNNAEQVTLPKKRLLNPSIPHHLKEKKPVSAARLSDEQWAQQQREKIANMSEEDIRKYAEDAHLLAEQKAQETLSQMDREMEKRNLLREREMHEQFEAAKNVQLRAKKQQEQYISSRQSNNSKYALNKGQNLVDSKGNKIPYNNSKLEKKRLIREKRKWKEYRRQSDRLYRNMRPTN